MQSYKSKRCFDVVSFWRARIESFASGEFGAFSSGDFGEQGAHVTDDVCLFYIVVDPIFHHPAALRYETKHLLPKT